MTNDSAALNLVSATARTVRVEWGTPGGGLGHRSGPIELAANIPAEHLLTRLPAQASIRYRIVDLKSGECVPPTDFRTAPRAGSTFTFTVQGDSHPERPQMCDARLYARTLNAIRGDKPDLHFCMGDDFSVAHLDEFTAQSVESRYLLQRPFLGIVGRATPVFLVNGNHEQASLANYNAQGDAHDVAVWAQRARNQFFPLPLPGTFYSGNNRPLDEIGSLRDHHAWTWGDALFITLDNYWHSPVAVDTRFREDDAGKQSRDGKNRDAWGITIGDEQYQWLAHTLSTSRAKYKFVFAHHVLGTGRGGIERAPFYEWGGKSPRGNDEFAERRPKWELPIHQLMVKHGVTVFFQGHDHLYASQELDGLIYQTVPVPGDVNYSIYNAERYTSGTRLPNSGYLRVRVGPRSAEVEYVRTYLESDLPADAPADGVAHRYSITPKE